jgi:hypothetical protein
MVNASVTNLCLPAGLSRQYVQITGCYKSGTSLLYALFDGHPEILSFPSETLMTGHRYKFLTDSAMRDRGYPPKAPSEGPTPAKRHATMTWAQRLKRVFKIDIETCSKCGGTVKVIACIEDPVVIEKILTHVNLSTPAVQAPLLCPTAGHRRNLPCSTESAGPRNFASLLLPTRTRQGIGWPQSWNWMFKPENRQSSAS